MTVRIYNLDKWRCLEPASALDLSSSNPDQRRVRVEVNCPAETRFDVIEDASGPDRSEARQTFLALVKGYQVLEFSCGPHAALVPTGGDEVWLFTNDGEDTSYRVDGAISFTQIIEREARNPKLEQMMFKMQMNIQRNLEAQAHERAARDALRDAELRRREAALAKANPETGEIVDDGSDGDGTTDGGATGNGAKPPASTGAKDEGVKPDGSAGA